MAEMMTSSDGAFVLSDVPAGVYKLAMLDVTWRYVSGYLGGSTFESASDVVVAVGGTTNVGTVDIAAWCYVNGDLYDWTGSEPVFGATVRAYAQAGEGWDVVASTRTADNGGWSIRLPEGVYRIGYESPSDASVVYHPAADTIDSARDIVVTRAGVWLSARLLSPEAPLSGSVTIRDNGTGVQGIRIDLSPVEGGADISTTTDEHGFFSEDVSPGSYRYEAACPDGGFAFVSGMTVVAVGAGTVIVGPEGASLDFVVVPVAMLRGTISDKLTGAPVVRSEVELIQSPGATLHPEGMTAATDSDGAFEIKSLPAGSYTVRATVPDSDVDWYLGDVRSVHDATWFSVTS
ncbi:MAG: carboxypeptidase regulatory-like domain-containing protein [Actinomycetota bacterium]|nr:carboxypeptidase regulatory-like domain-containing protein [Actinomycetota bacterium]